MSYFAIAPLLNLSMVTEAYLVRRQPGEDSLLPVLMEAGVSQLAKSKPLLVELSENDLKELVEQQEQAPQLVPVLPSPCEGEVLQSLRARGYSMAVRGGEIPVPEGVDYYILDGAEAEPNTYRNVIQQLRQQGQSRVRMTACGLGTWAKVAAAKNNQCALLEGLFYYMPEEMAEDLEEMESAITPMQTNLIQMINTMRDETCDFKELSRLVGRDPALTISLLRLVNSPYIGVRNRVKSIPQAVALLGQEEVRKWIATAVFKYMGTDKPNELTRGSLIRAKFMENLAPAYSLKEASDSLFLVGLFSSLEGMLGVPMAKALELMPVDAPLQEALLEGKGPYAPALRLVLSYESVDWNIVEEQCRSGGLSADEVLQAYLRALAWCGDVLYDPA